MAITVTLVGQFANRLRYLCVQDGAAGTTATIPNDAGASPDLQTDTAAFSGPLFQIARARSLGIGTIAANTALNQAQARAILMDDNTTSVGNANVPRARSRICSRTTPDNPWTVDANVDGGGDPVLTLISGQAACSAYLDVVASGAALSGD